MRLQRRKRLDVLVPIATMGDIAFLLIIFFILATTMIREANLDVTPAASRDIDKQQLKPISITMDTEGLIYLQGDEKDVGTLESDLTRMLDSRPEKIVTVRIDKDIEFEQFKPVLMAVSKAGGTPNLTGTKIEE